MIVVVNNVRSSHNVGTIFRTSDAIGVQKIYLCGYTPTPLDKFGMQNKSLIKVSLGAENTVEWRKFSRIGKAIDCLKNDGYKIYALETGCNAVPYNSLKFTEKQLQKVALIVGNERRGISKQVLSKVDQIVYIPMNGEKESLNLGVAFAIAAFGWRDFL